MSEHTRTHAICVDLFVVPISFLCVLSCWLNASFDLCKISYALLSRFYVMLFSNVVLPCVLHRFFYKYDCLLKCVAGRVLCVWGCTIHIRYKIQMVMLEHLSACLLAVDLLLNTSM